MINISTLKRVTSLAACAAAMIFAAGSLSEANAQRDPFSKPGFMRPRPVTKAAPPKPAKVEKPVVPYAPPSVEARIEYYKRQREAAAAAGEELPKVTSVLLLNEMSVSGIFKTPRGYAAIVEATPIKLSYTIYPGEKFFDGQLVAVDENRLVFRKVTKVSDGKFVSSVENKPLKSLSSKDDPTSAPAPVPPVTTAAAGKTDKPAVNPFLSPVDEFNSMPEQQENTKEPVKTAKKPAKTGSKK